ncbi:hypothetical protein GOB44_27445 [Sinorhizobium meliloti]|nr:hypothetical protein [Sinorhizobium meliloti]MDW9713550.1 hypothetical protein [Sinorhizobium meliloti]MDW9750631.1 hypothetical protein [Sinorhizobium meliloti]MDX0252303.1 hypothetical protein [Sinorhizobium meliloti]MDX0359617.1 hypothetical protein [Sinorhizobium meliloti]
MNISPRRSIEWVCPRLTGIERDIEWEKASLTVPWSTSPVEGQINRLKNLKMIKRQMYRRSGYSLLKSKVLARV